MIYATSAFCVTFTWLNLLFMVGLAFLLHCRHTAFYLMPTNVCLSFSVAWHIVFLYISPALFLGLVTLPGTSWIYLDFLSQLVVCTANQINGVCVRNPFSLAFRSGCYSCPWSFRGSFFLIFWVLLPMVIIIFLMCTHSSVLN